MNYSNGPTRRSIRVAGSHLSVIDEGTGPAILLGHGYLWNWEMWEPQLNALTRRNRVILPEMWGHGESGPLPPATHGLPDLAGHMLELLDRLEVDRCVITGLSMGGMWGAHLASSAPGRVAGLVIMNSFLGSEPDASRTAYGELLDLIEREGRFPEHVIEIALPLFFAADVEERFPDLPRRLRRHIASFGAETLRNSIVPLGRIIFDRKDGRDILPKIECPKLVLAGACDVARPPAESIEMAAQLGTSPIIIPDCGHTSSLEQSEEVNRILAHFLDEIGWRSSLPHIARELSRSPAK